MYRHIWPCLESNYDSEAVVCSIFILMDASEKPGHLDFQEKLAGTEGLNQDCPRLTRTSGTPTFTLP